MRKIDDDEEVGEDEKSLEREKEKKKMMGRGKT